MLHHLGYSNLDVTFYKDWEWQENKAIKQNKNSIKWRMSIGNKHYLYVAICTNIPVAVVINELCMNMNTLYEQGGEGQAEVKSIGL